MSEQLHSLSRMTTRGSTRWYQEPFAWLVLGIPVVAVLTGMIMLSLSIRGFDGLVVDDYYKRGKEINRTLERDQAAVDQALSAQLSMEPGRLVLFDVTQTNVHTVAPVTASDVWRVNYTAWFG